jgi:hypothetical protein
VRPSHDKLLRVGPKQSALPFAAIVDAIFVRNVVFRNFSRFERTGIGVARVLDALNDFRFEILPFFGQLFDALKSAPGSSEGP